MKSGTTVFALTLLTLISSWGLSGYAMIDSAAAATDDTHNTQAGQGDDRAQPAEAGKTTHKGQKHARRDGHPGHGDKTREHKHHRHAEHQDPQAGKGSVRIGDKVPDFAVQTLDGSSVQLSELQKDSRRTRNGVVVLSFWCTTCHSCRHVEHELAELCRNYLGEAAVFALAANVDETTDGVTAFLKENSLELPAVLDPGGTTADLFGVKSTTTTVVIDGNRVLRYCGQFEQEDDDGDGSAEAALKSVLAGQEVAVTTTPHRG